MTKVYTYSKESSIKQLVCTRVQDGKSGQERGSWGVLDCLSMSDFPSRQSYPRSGAASDPFCVGFYLVQNLIVLELAKILGQARSALALVAFLIRALFLRQAVAGKAPAGMNLIDEDALFHCRVLVQDRFCLIDIGIEEPDASQVATIGDGSRLWETVLRPGGGNSSWRAPR